MASQEKPRKPARGAPRQRRNAAPATSRSAAAQPEDAHDYYGDAGSDVDAATEAEELRRLLGEEA